MPPEVQVPLPVVPSAFEELAAPASAEVAPSLVVAVAVAVPYVHRGWPELPPGPRVRQLGHIDACSLDCFLVQI